MESKGKNTQEAKNQRSGQTSPSSNSSGSINNNNNNSNCSNYNNTNNNNSNSATNNNTTTTATTTATNNTSSSKNSTSNNSDKTLTSSKNTNCATSKADTTTSSSSVTTTTTVTSNITSNCSTTTSTISNSTNSSIGGGLCTSTTSTSTTSTVSATPTVTVSSSASRSSPHEGNACGNTNMNLSGSGVNNSSNNGTRLHHQQKQQQCTSISSSTMNNKEKEGVSVVPVSSSKTPSSSAHTSLVSSSNLRKMNEPQSTADSTTISTTTTSSTNTTSKNSTTSYKGEEKDPGPCSTETPAEYSPSGICSPLTPPSSSLSNYSVSSSASTPLGPGTPSSYPYYPYTLGITCSDSPTHNYLSSGARSGYNNVATTPSMKTSTVGCSGGGAIGGGPYNWQASKVTVKERMSYLFNTDIMCDVRFQVGKPPNSQLIPAHKFVLSVGSAVFDALFSWMKCSPSSSNGDNVIEIPDVEPAAFLALLRFLYCDEVLIDPETVMTTLYAAKKYSVPALERSCVDFLKRNLSSDNAFMLLTQARLFDESQLAALCLETIDKNTSEAINADGFTDIDIDTMCVVLERNSLGIRECKLFSAVCRWAEAECSRQNLAQTPGNQRKVLGKALKLIRFPLMSVEEFAMGAAQSGILLDREVVELFLHFTVNPKPPISFSDVPRCCLTGKEQIVLRFCQIESRWGYSGTSDRIRFMVNRRIFVVGFGLYGSIHGPTEYLVNIELLHSDTGRILGQNDTSFQCDGSTSTFRVMFKKPVEILPNTSFTACATLKGPDSYYGSRGLRKVTHESVASGKVTFQFTYATGNNNGTSVEDGQIPEIIFYT